LALSGLPKQMLAIWLGMESFSQSTFVQSLSELCWAKQSLLSPATGGVLFVQLASVSLSARSVELFSHFHSFVWVTSVAPRYMRIGVPLAYRASMLDRMSSRLTLLSAVGSGRYPPIASHWYWRCSQETYFRGAPTVTHKRLSVTPHVLLRGIQPAGHSEFVSVSVFFCWIGLTFT